MQFKKRRTQKMTSGKATVMEDKKILKEAISERKITQVKLAEKMGVLTSALSMNITRDRMGLDNFKSILNALGYDVAVIDRETGDVRWIVDPEK